jgi:hypothetical protein
MRTLSRRRRRLILAGLLLLAWGARYLATSVDRDDDSDSQSAIAEAFRDRRSGLMVEAEGTVERLLADDREGSPHQRLIVRLAGGQTVLVSHNIELAPRVPATTGDRLGSRGQYEWSERGGVVHWTHHDPQGRRPGGWLRHRDQTYR